MGTLEGLVVQAARMTWISGAKTREAQVWVPGQDLASRTTRLPCLVTRVMRTRRRRVGVVTTATTVATWAVMLVVTPTEATKVTQTTLAAVVAVLVVVAVLAARRQAERGGKRERGIMLHLSPGPPALLPSDRAYQIPSE